MSKITKSAISLLLALCLLSPQTVFSAFAAAGDEISSDSAAIFDSANGSVAEGDENFDSSKYYTSTSLPSSAFDGNFSTNWQLDGVSGTTDIDDSYYTMDPDYIGLVYPSSISLGSLDLFWEIGSSPYFKSETGEAGYSVQALVNGVYKDVEASYSRTTATERDGAYKDTVTLTTPVATTAFRIYITSGNGRYNGNPKYAPKLFECVVFEGEVVTVTPSNSSSSSVGAQRTRYNSDSNVANLRLISAVDSLNYKKVGFEVTVNGVVSTYSSQNVYTEVGTYYPVDFGSGYKYLFCLVINNVPGDATISVRSFTVALDGQQRYSDSSNIKMNGDDMTVNSVTESSYNTIKTDYVDTVLGDYISLTPMKNDYVHLVDNSGMSGLWSGNQLHAGFDNTTSEAEYGNASMYYSSKATDLDFDIGYADSLGKLFIWNYNDTAALNSGVRTCEIYYSLDNENWILLDTYMLAKCNENDNSAYGGNTSTNVAVTNLPIDFEGTVARYIRIRELTNWGGSGYGLSEVRLFRHKTSPEAGGLIYPYAYTQQTLTGNDEAVKAINGSGMSDRTSVNATASNDPADMWYSTESAADSLLVLDLDGNYPVSSITLWNYNAAGATGNGIKNFRVYYSVTDPYSLKQAQTDSNGNYVNDTIDWSGGNWKQIGGTYTLPQASGQDGMASSLTVDLGGIHAQFLKILPTENWGGTGFGLSEVRVTCGTGWMVEPSRYWTGILSSSGSFAYQGNTSSTPFATSNQGTGWVGGDGFFSTSLTGDNLQGQVDENSKTFFSFQDSFMGNFGNYRDFSYTYGYAAGSGFTNGMKNMTYMFLDGNKPDVRKVQFHTSLKNGLSDDNSLGNVLPNNHYGTGYWIGDSTVVDGNLYTIATCIENGWGTDSRYVFRQPLGSDGFPNMASEPVAVLSNTSSDLDSNGYPTTFNRAFANEYFSADQIFEQGDYLYLVGKMRGTGWLLEGQNMIIARMKKSDLPSIGSDSNAITYWNGSSWTLDMSSAAAISTCTPGNEFNITYCTDGPFAGKYVCIYTEGSIWGTVKMAVSDSLTGTFTNPTEATLYFAPSKYQAAYQQYTTEAYAEDTTSEKPSYYNIYTQWNYNAKAQAAISGPGELLITYHFGNHDDRTPSWGWFGAVTKEYEHPTFISLTEVG